MITLRNKEMKTNIIQKTGGENMHILLCIDDTDNIDSKGTGDLAIAISEAIEEKNWGSCSKITRHQLFIHPDIPYTSHNSSMCFRADISEIYLDEIIKYASDYLQKESAEGSDPGLCVAVQEEFLNTELLIHYGRKAKIEILLKEDAYALAKKVGVHLSEHGGTGQGVIGALAGIGLRLSGNDGRFKGKIKLDSESGIETVGYIKSITGFERVKDINGEDLRDEELVLLGESLKAVLSDGKSTILVTSKYDETNDKPTWELCKKQVLSGF